MSDSLIPCPSCGVHVFADSCRCPDCGGTVKTCSGVVARSAVAAAMGLALTACSGDTADKGNDSGNISMDYGVAESGWMDADGDGWSIASGDCDDGDAEVNPDATETAGDDVDSNCDGEDDT